MWSLTLDLRLHKDVSRISERPINIRSNLGNRLILLGFGVFRVVARGTLDANLIACGGRGWGLE